LTLVKADVDERRADDEREGAESEEESGREHGC